MAKTTKTTKLEWTLEAKNFDDLKNEMIQDGDGGMAEYVEKHIGDNHCKACVLASGPMCIHRKVCRIPQNEVWINGGIEEFKDPMMKEINSEDIHPDTYEKPYFAIVEEDMPQIPVLEQLYNEDGTKHQIDGEDVRLCLRDEEAIDIHGLLTPPNLMSALSGKYAHDSIDWLCHEEHRIKHLLSMSKSYREYKGDK